jgi:hypothetical protein
MVGQGRTLLGVASWQTGAIAPPKSRIIACFRPQMKLVKDWLNAP